MYLCGAVAGPLHSALLRNAWLDSGYMFCDSSGCVGCIALFYVKGNSVSVVVSVSLSWLGLRATLNGEVCTVEFSVAFRAVVFTWNLDSISPSPLFYTVLRSLVRCCLRSVVDFLGALDDSQL